MFLQNPHNVHNRHLGMQLSERIRIKLLSNKLTFFFSKLRTFLSRTHSTCFKTSACPPSAKLPIDPGADPTSGLADCTVRFAFIAEGIQKVKCEQLKLEKELLLVIKCLDIQILYIHKIHKGLLEKKCQNQLKYVTTMAEQTFTSLNAT